MSNIPTIEDYLSKLDYPSIKVAELLNSPFSKEIFIEFTKLHVEEFRKECLKNVKTRTKKIPIPNSGGGYYTEEVVDRKTIRKAYPLTNIK